jgi:hypothetical protein
MRAVIVIVLIVAFFICSDLYNEDPDNGVSGVVQKISQKMSKTWSGTNIVESIDQEPVVVYVTNTITKIVTKTVTERVTNQIPVIVKSPEDKTVNDKWNEIEF